MPSLRRPPAPRAAAPAGAGLPRRQFLVRGGALGGFLLVGGSSLLAACGGDDDEAGSDGGSKVLRFSNWPAYIDEETVKLFEADSGINMTYNEDYNDNNEYFAKIQPILSQGDSLDVDLIAPTYWLVPRLIQLEWLDPMPTATNAKNLVTDLVDPAWDPDGTYSLPWQSGMTGIAYNRDVTGRDLGSIDDLFDPEFKGKIGMLTELRDTVGLVMLGEGEDVTKATFESAQGALDRIEGAKSDGQIRQFTGNDYMDDLAAGNFAACVGWSGDISQLALDNPAIKFVIPESGGMRWSDCMVVPKGTENTASISAWIDWVYDPVNAARITAFVGYNSPVQGVKEELAKDPATAPLAESPLVFPDEATLANLNVFATLSEEEEAMFDERFSAITGA